MLSPRLQAVASFVSQGAVLADIGSDHAYLPCALVEQKTIAKAYACEVKEGPLQCSIRTIEAKQLTNQVIALLSDGLLSVPDDVTEIVIAGMGVHTVLTILRASHHRLPRFHRIIVQVNGHVELLRRFLSEQQFRVIDETIVFDEKFYEVVVFEAKYGRPLTEAECYFGPILLQTQSDVFQTFYRQKLHSLTAILQGLSEHSLRYRQLQSECKLIEQNIKQD